MEPVDAADETAAGASEAPAFGIGSFLRRLRPYLARYPLFLAVILACLILETAFDAFLPLAFKYIIDEALIGDDMAVTPNNLAERVGLIRVIVALGLGVVLVAVTGIARNYLLASMIANVVRDIRTRMYTHLQRLSLDFFGRNQAGDILSRFSGDLVTIETTLVNAVTCAVLPGMCVLVGAGVLFYLDARLALIAMLAWPLCLFLPNLFAAPATRAGYEKKRAEAVALAAVQENLAAPAVVRAFGLAAWSLRVFAGRNARLCASTRRYGFLSALIEHSSIVGLIVLQVVVLGIGAWMAWRGEISIGGLAAFQSLFVEMSTNLGYVTTFTPNVIESAGSMERLDEILREAPGVADAPGARPLPGFAEAIELRDVSFGYAPAALSLEHVSLAVRRGERVAFVGGSGSGKSTVLSLILRFYDPTAGTVLCDGVDIRTVTQDSLRARIGVVFQDNYLFDISIRENLRLGRPAATDAEVETAARAAEIHEAIVSMPAGYDTPVGERGGRLSGGQRQRLAIARALLRDPEILVLDEATSALDPVTEEAINKTLERIGRSRTVLMVSHRLAAVQHMDRIVVLERGRIREQGDHAALLGSDGLYAELWRKQGGFAVSGDGSQASVTAARLREFPVFAELPARDLDDLAGLFVTEQHPAGAMVVKERRQESRFFIIVRGRVRVERRGMEVARLAEGDYFGETSLLVDIPALATIATLEPCLFLTLQHDLFARLVERTPALRARLERVLDRRIEELAVRMLRAREEAEA